MKTQEQLDQINEAIAAVETGAQSYRIGSREITRPNIMHLYNERERLERLLALENGGGVYVATFDRR